MRRVLLCTTAFALAAASASAEPWYRGPHGNNRVFHLTLSASLGIGFIVTEGIFKSGLAATDCRWCEPDRLDVRVRDALVWNDDLAVVPTRNGLAVAGAF